ncbi:MAG: hypothetical protein MI824_01565 [Hyphomicrobiales bacterium]|nr:hypothetical protein [Hyphomicrobiales bacterium]
MQRFQPNVVPATPAVCTGLGVNRAGHGAAGPAAWIAPQLGGKNGRNPGLIAVGECWKTKRAASAHSGKNKKYNALEDIPKKIPNLISPKG